MLYPQAQQQRQQRRVSYFAPKRAVFKAVGVQLLGCWNVGSQEVAVLTVAHFQQPPGSGEWARCVRKSQTQLPGQPGGRDELTGARQVGSNGVGGR